MPVCLKVCCRVLFLFLTAEKGGELFEFMASDIKLFSQVLRAFDAANPNWGIRDFRFLLPHCTSCTWISVLRFLHTYRMVQPKAKSQATKKTDSVHRLSVPIILQRFCRKLHENNSNWTERGTRIPSDVSANTLHFLCSVTSLSVVSNTSFGRRLHCF